MVYPCSYRKYDCAIYWPGIFLSKIPVIWYVHLVVLGLKKDRIEFHMFKSYMKGSVYFAPLKTFYYVAFFEIINTA